MYPVNFSDGINNALELSIVSSAELADQIIADMKEAVDNHINPNNVSSAYSELTDYDCSRIKREVERYIRSKGRFYEIY